MPQVRYRLEALQPTPWLAIDCESTGFDTRRDAIVQLALLPFDTHNVYVKDLIYFDIKSVKKFALPAFSVHGLLASEGVWAESAAIARAAELCRGRWLVGHYIHLDRGLIECACRRHGISWQVKGYIDTLQLAARFERMHLLPNEPLQVQRLSLQALCERFALPIPDAHTAMGDALATALLFQRLSWYFAARSARLPVYLG